MLRVISDVRIVHARLNGSTFLPMIPLQNIHLKNILSKLHNISLTKTKQKEIIINNSNTEYGNLVPGRQ